MAEAFRRCTIFGKIISNKRGQASAKEINFSTEDKLLFKIFCDRGDKLLHKIKYFEIEGRNFGKNQIKKMAEIKIKSLAKITVIRGKTSALGTNFCQVEYKKFAN
jgi:hypothetical protein